MLNSELSSDVQSLEARSHSAANYCVDVLSHGIGSEVHETLAVEDGRDDFL